MHQRLKYQVSFIKFSIEYVIILYLFDFVDVNIFFSKNLIKIV